MPSNNRLGILLSGRGSNFRSIHQSIQKEEPEGEITCVISNVETASGLEYARQSGLPCHFVDHRYSSREDFDRIILSLLQEAGVTLVCLAGFMRLLSPVLIDAFPRRILNIHPSLLPAFPGLHAQRQALEAGVKFSGCSVHFVEYGLDSGPIILQSVVPVLDHDTEDTLSARILMEEHQLYPKAIHLVLGGKHHLEGRRYIAKG